MENPQMIWFGLLCSPSHLRMSTLPMALILGYLNNFVTTIPPRSVYIKESLPLYPAMMFLSI